MKVGAFSTECGLTKLSRIDRFRVGRFSLPITSWLLSGSLNRVRYFLRMNIPAVISAEPTPGANWDAIFDELNAWRGACLHHFSAAEMAVTETLLALSKIATEVEVVRLRPLLGQRYEDLAVALRADGPRDKLGQSARDELANYRDQQEAFRNLLCHGMLKVMVDRNNRWTLVIRTLAIRSRQPERSVTVITHKDACERLAHLKRDSQRLSSTLGQLRKSVPEY